MVWFAPAGRKYEIDIRETVEIKRRRKITVTPIGDGKAFEAATELRQTFIEEDDNMNRWRLFWVQSQDLRANTQEVWASLNGGPEAMLIGGLGMTASQYHHNFAPTDQVTWRVKTLNADRTLQSFSVPSVFSAASPLGMAPATLLDQEFVQVV